MRKFLLQRALRACMRRLIFTVTATTKGVRARVELHAAVRARGFPSALQVQGGSRVCNGCLAREAHIKATAGLACRATYTTLSPPSKILTLFGKKIVKPK